jgi:hypothetical protein
MTHANPGGKTMHLLHIAVALGGLPGVPGHAGGGPSGQIPDPEPAAPPGLAGPVGTLLGWWKWASLVGGVFGLIGCGAMMAIGRRNRSSLAADGATGIPWVLAGLTLIALSSGIVGVFM